MYLFPCRFSPTHFCRERKEEMSGIWKRAIIRCWNPLVDSDYPGENWGEEKQLIPSIVLLKINVIFIHFFSFPTHLLFVPCFFSSTQLTSPHICHIVLPTIYSAECDWNTNYPDTSHDVSLEDNRVPFSKFLKEKWSKIFI